LAKRGALNASAQIACGFATFTSTPGRLIALKLSHFIEPFEPFRIAMRECAVIVQKIRKGGLKRFYNLPVSSIPGHDASNCKLIFTGDY
jgi:hypothetical protein